MKNLTFLILLPAFVNLYASPGDSLKTGKNKSIYALDDPRNPDCPCHEQQRKADEEYRKQMDKESNAGASDKENNRVEIKPQRKGIHLFHRSKARKNSKTKKYWLHRKKIKKLLDDCPVF